MFSNLKRLKILKAALFKDNKIILDHKEREDIILIKLSRYLNKDFKNINVQLLEEVVNIVENPNILLVSFNKEYLKIQKRLLFPLEKHQRYFNI